MLDHDGLLPCYGVITDGKRHEVRVTFVGISANALKTQIWTVLIAMILINILHMQTSFGWHLSNFMVLLRQQLFVYRDL
jgi:hypothetical protein